MPSSSLSRRAQAPALVCHRLKLGTQITLARWRIDRAPPSVGPARLRVLHAWLAACEAYPRAVYPSHGAPRGHSNYGEILGNKARELNCIGLAETFICYLSVTQHVYLAPIGVTTYGHRQRLTGQGSTSANTIPACAIVSSRWPSTTCCRRGACPGGWSYTLGPAKSPTGTSPSGPWGNCVNLRGESRR